MPHQINLCTSILPKNTFDEVIAMALDAGFDGIELRVADNYHQSLTTLEKTGRRLRRSLERRGLDMPVLNTYVGIDDEPQVSRLLACAQKMDVPKLRLTLPVSARASVAMLSREREIIPSYESCLPPVELVDHLRRRLGQLETMARRHGVKVLVELHWGTVMSSFSGAYLLLNGLDPACIALTFDPANMVVEGREDWEFGMELTQAYIDNVHVKNAAWSPRGEGWRWGWSPMFDGLVSWGDTVALLQKIHYEGHFAVEDFLTPRHVKADAVAHLRSVRCTLATLCRQNKMRIAA
jgi:sugar phosphate isomerase/epimerase